MRKKFQIKKPFYKTPLFWLTFFVGANLLFLFWFLFFSKFFLIKEIVILPENFSKKEDIKAEILKLAKQNFLKRENIFLFNTSQAQSNLLQTFWTTIENLKITKKLPPMIIIQITERQPIFIICVEKCYLVDKNGVAFQETEEKNFLEIEKETPVSLGETVLSEKFVQDILKVKENLEKTEIFLKKVKIEKEKVEFFTNEGWSLYFDFDKDLNYQINKMKALFEKEISKEKRTKLEYVDLRFGDIVSVKYKSQ